MSWTHRVGTTNTATGTVNALDSWDSYITQAGVVTGTATWSSGCNTDNAAILTAFSMAGAPLFVQGTGSSSPALNGSPASSFTCAFTSSNTAGNLIVVDVMHQNVTRFGDSTSLSDSQGNVYSLVAGGGLGLTGAFIKTYVAYNAAGGTNTCTITQAGGVNAEFNSIAMSVQEYSGGATGNSLGVSGGGASSNSITLSSSIPGAGYLIHLAAGTEQQACVGVVVLGGASPLPTNPGGNVGQGPVASFVRTRIPPTGAVQAILVPEMNSFQDVRQVLSQQLQGLQRQIVAVSTTSDFGGNRVSGVGLPQGAADAVPLGYLWQNILPLINRAASRGPVGSGGVSSLTLNVPTEFGVIGNPLTVAGTLTVTKGTESANTVWAGPASGAAAQPTFRALTTADVPFTAPVFEVGGTTNTSQGTLNLVAGTNVTITNPAAGTVVITASASGGGGGAWTQIAQMTSTASVVSFTSIPGTFSSLAVMYQARSSVSGVVANMYIQFNSNTSTTYNYNVGFANANGVAQPVISQIPGGSHGTFAGQGSIGIINYANTSLYKTAVIVAGYDNGSPGIGVQSAFVDWQNTSAITSIQFGLTSAGTFGAGSVFTLYGIQ